MTIEIKEANKSMSLSAVNEWKDDSRINGIGDANEDTSLFDATGSKELNL